MSTESVRLTGVGIDTFKQSYFLLDPSPML